MADDRKDSDSATSQPDVSGLGSAIPNRDRRREPPVIDAKAEDVTEVAETPAPPVAEDASTVDAMHPVEGTVPATPEEGQAELEGKDQAVEEGSKESSGADQDTKTAPDMDSSNPKDAETANPETANQDVTADSVTAPPPVAAAPPPRRSAGIGALMLSSVAGAAVAAGGGYSLLSSQYYSAREIDALLATGMAKSVAGLSGNVEAGQKKLEEQAGRLAASIDGVTKRITTLEAQAQKLGGDLEAARKTPPEAAAPPPIQAPAIAAKPAAPVDLGPIQAGLGDLEKRIAGIEKSLAAPKTEVRATDPDVKPPAAAQATADAPAASTPPAPLAIPPALIGEVAAITQRIQAIEARPEPKPADLGPLQIRLQELEQRLAPLAEKLGPLEQKLAPLEQKIAPLEAAVSQSQAALREALGGQTKTIEASQERSSAAALAVIAGSLAEAARSGAPFNNILKAAQTLGADANTTGPLQKFAEKGLPSAAGLAAQFAPIGAAILQAENKPAANATFAEKLAASAGKLVKVVPAEDTKEENAAALVTRIGAALRTAKFAEALALLEKLPPSAQAQTGGLAAILRDHLAADSALAAIQSAALARLSRQ